MLGEFRPDGVSREYCDVDVLRQLRRRSLASLRREVEPVEQQAFARFLPAWHDIPAERRGTEALVETLGVLSGAALVASTIEADVFPARVRGYSSSMLDELCTAGELVWVGAGGLGARDGRVRLCFADQLAQLAPSWEHRDPPEGPCTMPCGPSWPTQGASFWGQLRGGGHGFVRCRVARRPVGSRVGRRGDERLVRSGARRARRCVAEGRPPHARAASVGGLALVGSIASVRRRVRVAGAWWRRCCRPRRPRPRRRTPKRCSSSSATASSTREAVLAEGVVGGFSNVYGVLKVLEERGQVRRGYFVDGLGAAQFAVPGAVDRLRAERETPDPRIRPDDIPPPIVLAATDPAQPYGASLAWPNIARSPGPLGERAGGAPCG